MAEVYRAYQNSLDRFVAIKLLHSFLADDPEFKSRFEREAQNIAKLKHPNIVQVYDFDYDVEGESYYMVMELVDGTTLKERLSAITARGELIPIKEVIRIIREAASALSYAHSRNMIHRDVKPANLMLDHDNRVVLTDFGIAKIVTGAQFTASGGMVGTPAYMAPEQGLGEAGDERSDLYSLGIIMFQLLTGKLPYDADTPLAIVLKHLNTPTPSARDFNPDLPEALDRIVQKSIAKDAHDRYQDAAELIEDLNQFERTHINQGTTQPSSYFVDPDAVLAAETTKPAVTTSVADAIKTLDAVSTRPTAPKAAKFNGGAVVAGIAAVLIIVGIIGILSGLIPLPNNNVIATATETSAVVADAATEVTAEVINDTQTATATPEPATQTPSVTPAPTETPSHTPTVTPATPIAMLVQTSGNAVGRVGPGQSFARVINIQAGEQVTITGRSEDNLWFRVQKANTQEGWVQASLVLASGNIANVPVVAPPTLTPTWTPTFTATPSPTPTLTATATVTLTPTITPTPELDVTGTWVALTQVATSQAATQAACNWNYAAEITGTYSKYNPGDLYLIPVSQEFTLVITLTNLSNCDWNRNTALIYSSGEDFDAGRVVFFDDRETVVRPGEEAVITFEGRTPAKGGTITGTWILQTPGQNRIDPPLDITIRVFG